MSTFSGTLGSGTKRAATTTSTMIPRAKPRPTGARWISPGMYDVGGKTVKPSGGMFAAGKPTTTTTPATNTTPAATGDATEIGLRSILTKAAPGTPEYWKARSALNDYRSSLGLNVNIRKEESPYTGTSQYFKKPEVPAPNPTPDPPPLPDNGNAYFPGVQSFKPENYMNTEMFKQDLKDGTDYLDLQLEKAGLVGSGFNADQKLKLFDRTRANAQKNAMELAQIEADRYERIMNNEANRLTEQERNYQDTVLGLIDRGLKLYDINSATSSGAQKAEFEKWFGQQMASLAQQGQPRATGSSGGGSINPFIAPFPSKPPISQADLVSILQGSSQDAGYLDTIGRGIAGLFK